MPVYSGNNVKVSAGTLYAAPLLTAEPTAVTGAWPTGWVQLGYTDGGTVYTHTPAVATVDVEEEYYPIRYVTTGMADTLTFALVEQTVRNYLLALNAGIGSSVVGAATGTNPDGSIWVEAPPLGGEVRVMIGWDALSASGASNADPFGRIFMRQSFQTGAVAQTFRKGNARTSTSMTWSGEKPPVGNPVHKIYPASLAA